MDYLKDIEIDPDNLDVEWVNQPRLRMKYGELLAKANRDRDVSKRGVEVVKAALGHQGRDIHRAGRGYGSHRT